MLAPVAVAVAVVEGDADQGTLETPVAVELAVVLQSLAGRTEWC